MNGPNDLDDGWAELARELGLEGDTARTPAANRPPENPHPPEPAAEGDDDELVELPGDSPTDADVYAEADSDADAEPDDGEGDEQDADADDGDEAEGEGEPTGEPGEPKKKRRRRRRRKRKPGELAGAPAAEGEAVEESAEGEEDADADEPDEPPAADESLVEEEGATPAATRELIANWDVPSWETIVNTMLFRPQGR